MNKKIKILILEDLPSDVELTERELKSVLKDYMVMVTFKEKDFIEALENFQPDLIISDYKLPTFDGMKALQITRKRDEYIPFIILTGSMNEETAVECMKAGADDYVIKEHIKRLGPAILSALEKKKIMQERKQAEEALRESETRNRIIAEMISDYAYIFRVTPEGELRGEWVTESFTNVFGYTLEEVVARGGWQSLVYPDDLPIALAHAQKVARGEEDICEMRWVTARGEIRWLRDYAKPIFDETGKRVVRIYGASQDITERKQAEEALRQSRERLNHLLSVNPAIVYELDPENFSPTWVSPNVTEITGYTPEEALQPGWWAEHVHPEDREETKKAQERLMVEGRLAHEYRFQKKDGTYIWVRDELRLLRDEQDRPKEIVGSWMNITDRKEAEIELAKSEQRYRSIFENTGTAMLIVNEDGSIAFANKQCTATTGYSPEELQGTDWHSYVFADDLPMMENYFRLRFTDPEGAPIRYEARLIHADGSIRNALLTADIIPSTRQVVVSILDITKQVQAQEAARRASREWEEIFQAIGHPTLILSPQHTVITANQAALEATGMTAEELKGKRCCEVFHGTSHPPDDCPMEVMLRSDCLIKEVEMEIEALGGTFIVSCTPVFHEQGELEKVILIATDITKRKQAEEEIRKLSMVVESSPLAVVITDLETNIVYVNPALLNLGGFNNKNELIGTSVFDYTDEKGKMKLQNEILPALFQEGYYRGEIILMKKDRSLFPAYINCAPITDETGSPIFLAAFFEDITERKQAEEERVMLQRQLQQAQKLESIGRLAGGLAHDFNNMLGVILGYGEILLEKLHPQDPMRDQVLEIVKAGERAKALTRQLLAFSRKQSLQPQILDLNEQIRSLSRMLRRLIGEDITLHLALAEDLPPVLFDPAQLDQVIINLVVNSRDAMPEGGKLLIETAAVELDEAYAATHTGASPGKYVLLAVTDTGCGMDKETVEKIFEPFFTTKEMGKGTGLGLSTVYGIVKQSGGNIWVYSEPGKGTTFKIYLPQAEEKQEIREEIVGPEETSGGEHILVVEDEEILRNLLKTALTTLGYRVTLAANGGEALLLIEEKGLKPDLVITDMVMPNMSGKELIKRLRRVYPGLRALLMSGYPDNTITPNAVPDRDTPFIQKPFTLEELNRKVREVLAGKRP